MSQHGFKPGFGLAFEDFYSREGAEKIDAAFAAMLQETDLESFNRLMAARAAPGALETKQESELLLKVAPHLEDFIICLFGIEKEAAELAARHHELANIFTCKRNFVQRQAAKKFTPEEAGKLSGDALAREFEKIYGTALTEKSFADAESAEKDESRREMLLCYAAWALLAEEGIKKHAEGVLFKNPRKLDFMNLVPVETETRDGVLMLKLAGHHLRPRDGFKLTDDGGSLAKALSEANYCIWCHNQGKDSCSKGMREKDGAFRKSQFDVALAGCPLEEKISEMHTLKSQGFSIGALAMITVDNPMAAGTGHRICNDCMKSCIYQKQEPVNIPQAETRSLRDVLSLPYGFEIYSLLTRWNPLNLRRPLPRPASGYKVLVAGLGPAGFTLAHHLMNDGHMVTGIDGLKIEPLPEDISGVRADGSRAAFRPIRNLDAIWEELDKRTAAGFGGVAEYGITVRWDKNFLKVIRLLLERRAEFTMLGGVRFGSQITTESAFAMGFDHIALAMGAGKPTIVEMKNALARGVRAASDFLMALQLTGAARADSIANLQLRLPVAVIGGGLTAIDSATESLAYYPVQVEKFLSRYEALAARLGEEEVKKQWSGEEAIIAAEFLDHARKLRAAKNAEVRLALLKEWGGASLVYRKSLADSPSYRLNHEEVEKALEEGIFFIPEATPLEVVLDEYGHAKALKAKINGEDKLIPARTILMAAGTSPNTVAAREDSEHFKLDGKYFRAVGADGVPLSPEKSAKPSAAHVLMNIDAEGRAISFFGDLHPSYAGNVVKAMGSAKQGYPVVSAVLAKRAPSPQTPDHADFRASVHEVIRLTPNIVEIVLKAPLAAREFRPGQFYRLQNYEAFAEKRDGTTLAMEGLALTGAWVDREKGLVSTIVLEMGGSSNLCARLKPGENVVLMGPTGAPTHIVSGETVMLVGGGLGNAVLFSIGRAFREAGSRVLYFAGYKKAQDRYKVKEIEEAADVVIWCCDEKADFKPGREQDSFFHGNIVAAIENYAGGTQPIPLSEVNRVIAIGSDRMMAAVAAARHGRLAGCLGAHEALGSINSPMQCMMKEICAQCLQKHIDPATGLETYVYSCFNQDQDLDKVSWEHLNERLKQNSVQERLTRMWISACLKNS